MANNLFDFVNNLPTWVVLGVGMLAGGLRSIWDFVYQHTIGYALTRVTISLTVEDTEHRDAYLWLSCWAEEHLRGRKVNSLLLRVKHQEDDAAPRGTPFDVIPAYGTYYLLFRRRLMTVVHGKDSAMPQAYGAPARPMRWIRLQVWLCWNRELLLDVLEEARSRYENAQTQQVELYRADSLGDWMPAHIAPRAISSVFHPPQLLEDLLEDVDCFLHCKALYQELGVPYRRGYLLSGPPGTGKSSLILAIATQFRMPVYLVPLRGAELTAEKLSRLLGSVRKGSLVALEDVDCLQVATTRTSNVNDGLTMADLLNIIDGIGASEDRVLFMTANHPEKLDAALTRAGRVDRKFTIDFARDEELRRFHQRVAQTHRVAPWPAFRAALPHNATIADAQALAFQGKPAREALADERVCV